MIYYVAINGVKKDPMPEETLRGMISAGSIGADALCWREGWSNWQPVGTAFPALFPGHVPALATTADISTGQLPPADAEAVRKQYLNHEASLKSVGVLYLIGSVIVILVGIASLFGLVPDEKKETGVALQWLVAAVLIIIGGLQFQVGRWLRVLNPKARTPATLFAVLGLLGFPFGTLINGYILYLLRSKKGEMVFSESYHEVMAATPQIKYKVSIVIWILVGLLVLMLGLGMIGMVVNASHKASP